MKSTIASHFNLKGSIFRKISAEFNLPKSLFLGKGFSSFVFVHPEDSTKVLKFTVDEASIDFYQHSKLQQSSNSYYPEVFDIKKCDFTVTLPDSCTSHRLVEKPIWVVVMKRYRKVLSVSKNWKEFLKIKHNLSTFEHIHTFCENGKTQEVHVSQKWKEIAEKLYHLSKDSGAFVSRFTGDIFHNYELDICCQNIMQDEFGQLIATDPIASRWIFDLR